jgi:hypothetical protein
MGAAGESAIAIATLLKRTPHAVRKRAKVLKINLQTSRPPRGKFRNVSSRRWRSSQLSRSTVPNSSAHIMFCVRETAAEQ